MNYEDPVGIIELGNINIKCLIFKIKDNNDSEILSTSITQSDGIHNDVIVNLSKASNAIRLCISTAEKKANISLKKINVIFEQPDFLSTKFSKQKKIDGSKIYREDIEFLLKEGKRQLVLNDKNQSIIHIFNYNYIVDGKKFVEEPIGIFADSLTHEITFITVPKNNLKNITQAFINCDLEIERLISRTFVLGVESLNDKELQFGTVLINLGFERVSLGLFKNLALVHSITLPIGINHIKKDISKVCSLNLEESGVIRDNIDFTFQNNHKLFDENNYLKKNYFVNTNFRKISKKLILNVIKARIDEIFNILKKQLIIPEVNFNSGTNLLLLGEGSNLINIEKYCQNFFGSNLKNINKRDIAKNDNFKKIFASSLGAIKVIKDGWETEAIAKINLDNIEKKGFFSKLFGNR